MMLGSIILCCFSARAEVPLDVVAELTHGPSGLAVAPDNSLIVGLHQYFEARERVLRVDRQGELEPFPNPELGAGDDLDGVNLDAVMGVRGSRGGIVWMLDNGRRTEQIPKVVSWNYNGKKVQRVYALIPPATLASSFVADFAVDPQDPYLYIADPAGGSDAALIVLDRRTGVARRVLQGHESVLAEDIPFMVAGRKLRARRADGAGAEPLAGVNPIAVDRKGRFLYYGALKGRGLYRIPTQILKDFSSTHEDIANAVELYSQKPISDSIAIDARDNVYVADLSKGAIQIIRPKGKSPEIYVEDSKMCWPDGLTFGGDGRLYFYCSQMNRCSWFSGGDDQTNAPFLVYRVKPLFQPMISNPLPDRNPLTGIRDRIGDRLSREPKTEPK